MVLNEAVLTDLFEHPPTIKTLYYVFLVDSEFLQDRIMMENYMAFAITDEEQKNMFIYDVDDAKIKLSEMSYTPGLLKLIDEVISNIADEYRRKDNMGLTELTVNISQETGQIIIKDNGGIPVVKHKDAGVYLPEVQQAGL